jgi:hypothetical protein
MSFRQGKLAGVFGGEGLSKNVENLIALSEGEVEKLDNVFLCAEEAARDAKVVFEHGIRPHLWRAGLPPKDYVCRPSVSWALIGIIQARAIMNAVQGLLSSSFDDMRSKFSCERFPFLFSNTSLIKVSQVLRDIVQGVSLRPPWGANAPLRKRAGGVCACWFGSELCMRRNAAFLVEAPCFACEVLALQQLQRAWRANHWLELLW